MDNQSGHRSGDPEFDLMVQQEMAKMEAQFAASGGTIDAYDPGSRGGPSASLFGMPQDTGSIGGTIGDLRAMEDQRMHEYDAYRANLGVSAGQREIAQLKAAQEQAADGLKPVDFSNLPSPMRHTRQGRQAATVSALPGGEAEGQLLDTFTIGGTLSPGDERRKILSRQQEYMQALDRDKTQGEISSSRVPLRHPNRLGDDAEDDGSNPFAHYTASRGRLSRQSTQQAGGMGLQASEPEAPRNVKSLERKAHQERARQEQEMLQATSGMVFSEQSKDGDHSRGHSRQYGDELRQQMALKAEERQREKEFYAAPSESTALPVKHLPQNHSALQSRHSPVDPHFSLGEAGLISNLGAGAASSGDDAQLRRGDQDMYAAKIRSDEERKLRALAEQNVRNRYQDLGQASSSGIMGIGATSGSPVGKHERAREYQEQLRRDAAAVPIARERILLRQRQHVHDDEANYATYQTAQSETGSWQDKRSMQEAFSEQLGFDSSVRSVEDRSVDDYERDALRIQHQHRERYARDVMKPSSNTTLDYYNANEGDVPSEEYTYVDPREQQQNARLAAGSATAYAQQLKEQAAEARAAAEEAKQRGLAMGPSLPAPAQLAEKRAQQTAYARKLKEDSETAAVMMNLPTERVTMPKKDDGLGEAPRAPSRKVQEYHARMQAMQRLEEENAAGSLGDLQQGSPYKTAQRLDGEAELERGLRATGYGANRGPNPRQKPYVNEDDLYAKQQQKQRQQEYFRALEHSKTLKPIEPSRESWVRSDRTRNGLPNEEGIKRHYPPSHFPGIVGGGNMPPMNAVHLGHGYQPDGQFHPQYTQQSPTPQAQADFARRF